MSTFKWPNFGGAYKDTVDPGGWYHKINNWPDIFDMPRQSISGATNKLFWELLPILNDIFGSFEDVINKELNKEGLKLKFEYYDHQHGFSGANSKEAVDVYGIGRSLKG